MYNNEKSIKALLAFFAAILLALLFKAPGFFTKQNIYDIILNTSTTVIAGIGMLAVILIGQIDVSVGAILAVCCTITGVLAKAGIPIPLVVAATIVSGMVLGFINGVLVAIVKLEAIVATLSVMCIYRGIMILLTGGNWITGLPESILAIGQGRINGIPIPAVLMVVVVVAAYIAFSYTEAGRNLYAVGSNISAARLSGVSVKRVQIGAFAFNGAMIGLTALIFATRFGGVQSNAGKGFEMTAISAVVVGGASLLGGSGGAISTLLGGLLVSAIGTVLIFFHVDAYWEQAVQGAIILMSVASYAIKWKSHGKQTPKRGGKTYETA